MSGIVQLGEENTQENLSEVCKFPYLGMGKDDAVRLSQWSLAGWKTEDTK